MNILYQLFQNTSDAVFGVDKMLRVCFWSGTCEKLMGLSFDQVRDKKCYTVFSGLDLNGNPFCSPDCHASRMVIRGHAIDNYDLIIKGSEGKPIMVNVGACITPVEWQKKIDSAAFFVLRHIDCYSLLKRLKNELGSQGVPAKRSNTISLRENWRYWKWYQRASEPSISPTNCRSAL